MKTGEDTFKLLIIGATRRLGECLVDQAIEQGHHVLTFVRNPANYEKRHTRLAIVQGDILDLPSVDSGVRQCDVVLAAIAPKLKFQQKTQIFSKGIDNLLTALNLSNGRLIWVTTVGVDPQDLAATGCFFNEIFKPLFLQDVYADCALSESKLKASSTQWIVIHPHQTDGWAENGKIPCRSLAHSCKWQGNLARRRSRLHVEANCR